MSWKVKKRFNLDTVEREGGGNHRIYKSRTLGLSILQSPGGIHPSNVTPDFWVNSHKQAFFLADGFLGTHYGNFFTGDKPLDWTCR